MADIPPKKRSSIVTHTQH